jgi:hypothetical protein
VSADTRDRSGWKEDIVARKRVTVGRDGSTVLGRSNVKRGS